MHWFIPGFASMASVAYAHTVAKILYRKKKHGAIITLAPNPKDIVRPSSFCLLHQSQTVLLFIFR